MVVVLSVEPSSMMMSSKSCDVWVRTEAMVWAMVFSALNAGMITEMAGIRSTWMRTYSFIIILVQQKGIQ